MSIFKKIRNIFSPDSDEDYTDDTDYYSFESNIDKLEKKSQYPISPYQAFKIAEQDNNLKTNFFRLDSRYISYLGFDDCKVELVDGDNNRKYYLVNITKGEISWLDDDTFYDGIFCDNDFDLLQCLIDVETGEYIYYPKK